MPTAEILQTAYIGKGTIFSTATMAAPTVFTAIANVVDVSDPKAQIAHVETTNYSSTDKEFIPGMLDNGQLTLKLNYAEPSYSAIIALLKVTSMFQITKADGSTLAFAGFIDSMSGTNPIDNRLEQDVSIKVTGTVTYTPMVNGVAGTPVTF